jgi:glycosyltransferase involved in cell wall biosynthesis
MIIAQLARACYPLHPYGGLERHVYYLIRELARQGHIVHLFTQFPDPGLPPLDFKWPEGVIPHFVPYQTLTLLRRNSIPDRLLNYPLFSQRLARQLRLLKPAPQIVHAHGLAALGYALQPLAGIPLVLNPHGMEEFKNRSWLKQLAYGPFRTQLRYAAHQSATVIATDPSLITEVQSFLKVPDTRIALIPNALDLAELDWKLAQSQVSNSRLAEETEEPLILSVGRLEENKGFEVALAAFKLVAAQLPPGWRWLIIGEGSQRQQLETLTVHLGLSEKVRFVGKVSEYELCGYYRQAQLFLHSALYEGSSLVTLEALAAGLPVIASATGGLPDKIYEVGPNENGRLFQPGDVTRLAAHLVQMLHFPYQERIRLGQNGRRLVEQHFNWKVAGQSTLELYQKLQLQHTASLVR